jgi:hypothetical protein
METKPLGLVSIYSLLAPIARLQPHHCIYEQFKDPSSLFVYFIKIKNRSEYTY